MPSRGGAPEAEVAVDVLLARSLLRSQHPDLAGLAIRIAAEGWDNVTLRLGENLAIRLPRRLAAASLIENEQRWLPQIAPHLPLPVPAPIRIGAPGGGFPWSWTVVPWLAGESSDLAPPGADQGVVLAGFLRALHVAAPPHAPSNSVRGVALAGRRAAVGERLARVAGAIGGIMPGIAGIWQDALDAPMDGSPTWIHGDLHSRNVLVEEGALSAVIDWGDMCAGDAATDLAAIWTLLPDAGAREEAMQAYGPLPEQTWRRARGWAVVFGVMLLDAGLINDPRLARAGRCTLFRLLTDTGG